MTKYEYRALPCPEQAMRARDLPKDADPFCETLATAINELAREGWDYIRAETIEVKSRRFLRRRKDVRTFLVFRREARPLIDPRPIVDLGRDVEKVRARRVKSDAVVEFVRGGGRRVTPAPANADGPAKQGTGPATAAE
ncbi:MAG: hypothetical protein QNJ13_15270 [Paracoccaceae bacterium]|nr:hypothetical protein [Paracoccaceae bacterium]